MQILLCALLCAAAVYSVVILSAYVSVGHSFDSQSYCVW